MKTVQVTLHGGIHGVGFKYFVLKTAISHHIGGYVKNENDGAMTLSASGDDEDVELFLTEIEKGNGFSKIDCMSIEDAPYLAQEEFKVIY